MVARRCGGNAPAHQLEKGSPRNYAVTPSPPETPDSWCRRVRGHSTSRCRKLPPSAPSKPTLQNIPMNPAGSTQPQRMRLRPPIERTIDHHRSHSDLRGLRRLLHRRPPRHQTNAHAPPHMRSHTVATGHRPFDPHSDDAQGHRHHLPPVHRGEGRETFRSRDKHYRPQVRSVPCASCRGGGPRIALSIWPAINLLHRC